MFPARSADRTRKECWPSTRPPYDVGDEHTVKAPPSRLHADPETGSLVVNSKVAEALLLVASGRRVIVVFGGIVSTVHCQIVGRPTFPSESVAFTAKLCLPLASPE